MVLGNLIFQAEVVEQRFRAVVLPHHDQQASDDRNQTEHGRMLSSNMLLRNLILLIDVTFSTPTPVYVNNLRNPLLLGITLSRATIGVVTIELTRKHALLFTLLFATQTVGLWVMFSRSPVLAGLPRSIWGYFFSMVPGSAFLTTVILVELLRVVLPKNR